MIENTFTITNAQYKVGCVLEEYQGSYNICAAQQGQDGKIYLRWCYNQTKDRKPSEKTVPVKIGLGSKSQAIEMLETFVSILKGVETQTGGSGIDDGTIPF